MNSASNQTQNQLLVDYSDMLGNSGLDQTQDSSIVDYSGSLKGIKLNA